MIRLIRLIRLTRPIRSRLISNGRAAWLLLFTAFVLFTAPAPASAQEPESATSAVVDEAKEEISEAATDVADRVKDIDVSELTLEEIFAWLLVGLLVGSIAALFLGGRRGRGGLIGLMLLGVVGAVLGGIFVEVLEIDLGLGMLTIAYEQLVVGAILAVIVLAGWRYTFGRFGRSSKAGDDG